MYDKKIGPKYLQRANKGVERLISIVKDLDLISKYLNPYEIKSHLEIGCASGYKTFELAHRLNSKGFGIDPSTMAILEANKIKETFKIVTPNKY